jgi:hypothetical protein
VTEHGALPDVVLGEWLPDQPRVASPGLIRCENVLPTARGYRPWPGRSDALGRDPLAAECVGAWSGESQGGVKFILAGTRTGGVSSGPAIYLLWGASGALWDVSPTTAISGFEADGTWSFARVGTDLIATAASITQPLTLDVSSTPTISSDFGLISSDASRAAICAEFKDFLILGNIQGRGANSGIGTAENGIHWSALGDATSWPTVGTDAAANAQSDFQIFGGEGGEVTNIVPAGEYCLVFQENQVWRMDYVGLPAIFSFRLISPSLGCIVRNGAVAAGNVVFFISEDGFKSCDGARVMDIGAERVNDTFNRLFDFNNSSKTFSAYVPKSRCVLWTVPEGEATPNRIFGYQFELNRWFQILGQDTYQCLFSADSVAIGGSLDYDPLAPLNMDTGSDLATANLDLLGIADGAGTAAFFDSMNEIAYYGDTGASSVGYIETGDYEDESRQRRAVRWVRPIWNERSANITVSVSGRDYMKQLPDYREMGYSTQTGISKALGRNRPAGRYLRALFSCVGDYDEFHGFDVGFGDGRAGR